MEKYVKWSRHQIDVDPTCFRDLVPEIPTTGYLTHSIYAYPAKFIPHVVRHCILHYTRPDDCIVDPFAGSGTVGLEAYLLRRNAFLLDLNPLLDHIVPIKIYTSKTPLDDAVLATCLDEMAKNTIRFHPRWSNIGYWYPPAIYDRLAACWGWVHGRAPDAYTRIVQAALVKASRYFSYAEHTAPKLFRTRSKDLLIARLLQGDWESGLFAMVGTRARAYLRDVNALLDATQDHTQQVAHHGGVDSAAFPFAPDHRFDALITSPPYLQAQEYMRTAKLDLFWMGHVEEDIRALSRLEIPYRRANRIVRTETLDALKSKIGRERYVRMLDSYFSHTITALENAMDHLIPGARACIFIGNPGVDGTTVEIWRIFAEYFSVRGYAVEQVSEDVIKVRQLFGGRKNKNPGGMKSEFLLVLRRE